MSAKLVAYKELLEQLDQTLSCNGCNDFKVDNTPEMYAEIERANALNYGLTVLEWKAHEDYHEPKVSKDGRYIYTTDYDILSLIKADLGL